MLYSSLHAALEYLLLGALIKFENKHYETL
jgi:hypothetical protein